MSTEKKNPALGLDVGTSRLVVAQRVDQEFHYQTQLNAFVTIPYSRLTEGALRKEGSPHTVEEGEIVVHGNEAARFADLLGVETRRPMLNGLLNPNEPEGLSLMRQIVLALTGENKKDGRKVCFSIPAPPLGYSANLTYHEATLRQLLNELGYEAKSINEGLAVIYGELESTNYTGIGVSCGGGLCNVCLAYMSVPVLSFSVPKGGDFVDTSAASVTGELANRIRITKEDTFHFNGHYADKLHQVLSVYYEDMILSIVNGLKDALSASKNVPKLGRDLPLILSGGSTLPPGFRDRFEKILRQTDLPIKISEIRMAGDPLYSTAKGALVSALIDM
jgi:hypothetical protein